MCKNIGFTFLILLGTMALSAQKDSITWPLYEGDIPNNLKLQEEKVERIGTGRRFIRQISVPEITYYEPAEPKQRAVVICPGGGYAGVAIDHEGYQVARVFQERGYHAFVLKYRNPTGGGFYEDQSIVPLQDTERALEVAEEMLRARGYEEMPVGIMGFSAGGHLAATSSNRHDYDFAMLIYPVITFLKPHLHQGSRNNLLGKKAKKGKIREFSAELMVDEATPPTFLVHAADDGAVPVQNSLLYYEACLANGVPVDMHLYAGGGHGFGMTNPTTEDQWMEALLHWLKTLD
jgi:acetyl esterase/lipase